MSESRGRLSLLAVGVFYGAMAVAAVVASYLVFGEPPVSVGPRSVPLWASVVAGAGIGGALVVASRVSSARFRWARRLDANFRALLGEVGTSQAAFMALTSAIAEELLFRGFVLRLLLPRSGDLTLEAAAIALGVSSIGFGILHIGPDRSYLPWTAFAIVVGLLFGGLTLWTGDVTAAVIAHLTVNYFNFLALGRAR